uniref:Plac8 onzin related protein 6 n=1 Tax=Seriola lalandi dorsalis TaxID=1841481 RepID=A0A3B4WUC9_SERLL
MFRKTHLRPLFGHNPPPLLSHCQSARSYGNNDKGAVTASRDRACYHLCLVPGCFGLWCCPCLTCTTSTNFGECFCLPLLDNIILCPIVAMSMRVAMRYHYKIQGDMGSDCVYAYFCNVCSWCQMAREIKRHGDVKEFYQLS